MTQKNTGGPAFPGKVMEPDMGDPDTGETLSWREDDHPGMTLRDYFAAKFAPVILQLAMEGNVKKNDGTVMTPHDYAKAAYENADAMIEARNK